MASVKEMRTRIGSVKSTQKITKALQMVAAAKLRRAQQAAEAARPYARGHGGEARVSRLARRLEPLVKVLHVVRRDLDVLGVRGN